MKRPKGWRKGQTVFNFLQWLKTDKGIDGNQNDRMADPFYIDNQTWDEWWEEYAKLMGGEDE